MIGETTNWQHFRKQCFRKFGGPVRLQGGKECGGWSLGWAFPSAQTLPDGSRKDAIGKHETTRTRVDFFVGNSLKARGDWVLMGLARKGFAVLAAEAQRLKPAFKTSQLSQR
jgi:hypothetical protein